MKQFVEFDTAILAAKSDSEAIAIKNAYEAVFGFDNHLTDVLFCRLQAKYNPLPYMVQ